jgi:hypothetical protein
VSHERIFEDHLIDQIIGSPSKGVSIRSKWQALFIEHYSFVSFIEPMCVEETLKDPDWLLAMQEELNNFTRNNVWVFDPPPRTRISLRPNESSATEKMSMNWWCATKQDSWPKDTLKSNE